MGDTRQSRPLAGILLVVLALGITAAMVSITVAGEPRVGTLRGRVVDASGQPVAGAYVTVPDVNEDDSREVLTDEDGFWRAARIPVGYHEITAMRRGFTQGSQESGSLHEGQTLTAPDIVLHPQPDSVFLYAIVETVMPGKRMRLSLSGTCKEPEARARFDIYPYDLASAQTGQAPADGDAASLLNGSQKPVWSWERTYSTSDRDGRFLGEPGTPPLDRTGTYIAIVRVGEVAASQTLNVTDLSAVVKRDGDEIVVWCVKSENGAPAPGASVEAFSKGDLIASGVANGDGIFRAGFGSEAEIVVLVRSGGSLVIARSWHYAEARRDSLIYTDRPIYRPGHTVRFKGIFRKQKPGGFDVASSGPVLFKIEDPEGATVASIPATTNSNGTADGKWTIGEDARLGRYSVTVDMDGARYDAGFSVEEYRKPEYAASLSIKKNYHISGEPLKATLRSNYYFGAPVARAEVTYVVYSSEYYFWDYESDYESWFEDDEEGYGYSYSGYGDVVTEGRGVTDENGELQIELGTPGVEDPSRYTIEARVVDATMREVVARADTLVVPADFRIQAEPRLYIVKPGAEAVFDVKTMDWDGKPAPNKTLDAEIERVSWSENSEERNQAAVLTVTTGPDGRGVLRWQPDVEGYVEVTFTGKDPAGRVARGTAGLYVASEVGEVYENQRPDTPLTVAADKKMYRRGDTARILINTAMLGPTILLTVEGQTLFDARVIEMKGYGQTLEFPVRDEYLPNVNIVCTLVWDGRMASQQAAISVSPEDALLTVKVEAAKKRYKPGETANYTVQTLDSQGRGVPAEVSLGVVDESIYALRNDSTPDIQRYFWGPRESNVSTAFGGEGYYYGGLDKFESKVRRYFPDTAYWNPYIRTDASGQARVSFVMPDNLTTWRATARAVTADTRVGSAISKVLVTKDLIVRLQAPRFFRERDRQTLGVIVHNYTGQTRRVNVRLKAKGIVLKDDASRVANVPADGVAKLTWPIEAASAGAASITAEAIATDRSAMDAIEMPFEVFPHGARASVLAGGRAAPSSTASMTMDPESKLEGASLRIEITPSFAGAILQGLQYLAIYPWGCVEQTISSFVPDVLVKRASEQGGLPISESLRQDLPRMIAAGVKRLREMQHPDGSWGWYTEPEADMAMTAYALIGLVEARKAGASIPDDMLQRAAAWIRSHTIQELPPRPEQRDWAKAGPGYLGHLEARAYALMAAAATGAGDQDRFEPLWARRTEMTNVAIACMGLAAAETGRKPELEAAARMLESRQTRNSGMALWRSAETRYYWSDAGTTAMALRALTRAGRSTEQLEPVTRYLAAKRDGGYWNSTRDSALAILALLEHLERMQPVPSTAEVSVNGRPAGRVSLTREDYFKPPKTLVIPPSQLRRGVNKISVTKSGAGPVYWTGLLTYVSGQEDVPAKPGYFSVERSYGKVQLVKNSGGGYTEKVVPLKGAVRAGEVLRVQLKVKSSADASYVLIDSPLPSGFEVVNRERNWNWRWSGIQVRDEKVGLFSRTLPGGISTMEYDVRAEVPGELHVMPTEVTAMYSPSLFGYSAEKRLTVR